MGASYGREVVAVERLSSLSIVLIPEILFIHPILSYHKYKNPVMWRHLRRGTAAINAAIAVAREPRLRYHRLEGGIWASIVVLDIGGQCQQRAHCGM